MVLQIHFAWKSPLQPYKTELQGEVYINMHCLHTETGPLGMIFESSHA